LRNSDMPQFSGRNPQLLRVFSACDRTLETGEALPVGL
jgi:hypothetical protein